MSLQEASAVRFSADAPPLPPVDFAAVGKDAAVSLATPAALIKVMHASRWTMRSSAKRAPQAAQRTDS
jgi:hypothetical protein